MFDSRVQCTSLASYPSSVLIAIRDVFKKITCSYNVTFEDIVISVSNQNIANYMHYFFHYSPMRLVAVNKWNWKGLRDAFNFWSDLV